jgi:hypothetical protein
MSEHPKSCTPPAETKPRSFHELRHVVTGRRLILEWNGGWPDVSATTMHQIGYRYHSAVPEPEEVEALRNVVREAWDKESHALMPTMEKHGLAVIEVNAGLVSFRLTPLGRRVLGVEG